MKSIVGGCDEKEGSSDAAAELTSSLLPQALGNDEALWGTDHEPWMQTRAGVILVTTNVC